MELGEIVISQGGIFSRAEVSGPDILAANFNVRTPSGFAVDNSSESVLVLPLGRPAGIFTNGAKPDVGPDVVEPIAVDMVNDQASGRVQYEPMQPKHFLSNVAAHIAMVFDDRHEPSVFQNLPCVLVVHKCGAAMLAVKLNLDSHDGTAKFAQLRVCARELGPVPLGATVPAAAQGNAATAQLGEGRADG